MLFLLLFLAVNDKLVSHAVPVIDRVTSPYLTSELPRWHRPKHESIIGGTVTMLGPRVDSHIKCARLRESRCLERVI